MEPVVVFVFLCAAAVLGQDDKITCSIPPVEAFEDAVVTCNFPEDPSVTKRDFTINHYVKHGDPVAVVDCWWLRGNLDCSIRPGIEYNKTVNRQLSAVIRGVTSSHLGTYTCQLANYQLFEACELVFRHELIDCWWEDGHARCQVANGYLVTSNVSWSLTVLILDVTKETGGNYSCWHNGAEAGQQKICSLDKEEHSEDEGVSSLPIILISVLLGAALVVAVVILLVRYGRKILSGLRRQRSSNRHETWPMLELDSQKRVRDGKEVTKDFQEHLENMVKELYPDTMGTFHFVPPVYFNKTRYKTQSVAGQTVYVPDSSDPSDVRHDVAMHHVMRLLRHMAENRNEQMFVLTQFRYEDYLNSPGKDFERHLLPTAKDHDKIKCFDFLIIHRDHGLLIGVVNTVGDEAVGCENTQQKIDGNIAAHVNEAIQQLQKADRMISHFMSDQEQCPKIQRVLILPNLSQTSLYRATPSESDVDQCDIWNDIKSRSLCADHLAVPNTPRGPSSECFGKVEPWWDRLLTSSAEDVMTNNAQYQRLISRFCGPATQLTLQVEDKPIILPKTLAETVSVTGDLYDRVMLDADMMDLFKEERLFLVGPPNTCKTRMLTLAGEKWMESGSDLSVMFGSSVQCDSVMKEFCEKLKQKPDAVPTDRRARVYKIQCNFPNHNNVEDTLDELTTMKGDGRLCVLADEVDADGEKQLKLFKKFCDSLKRRCPDVHLWATCRTITEPPDGWKVRQFTRSLNCPPPVITEASQTSPEVFTTSSESDTHNYLPPADGPSVKYIDHKKDSFLISHDCMLCGIEVAHFLSKHLFIRTDKMSPADAVSSATDPTMALGEAKSTALTRPALYYKDMLILFEGDVRQGKDFLEGLTKGGVAVRMWGSVENKDRCEKESDFACAMDIDQLRRYRPRRKVVVYVENKTRPRDLSARWRGITCCTSQLILVRRNLQ